MGAHFAEYGSRYAASGLAAGAAVTINPLAIIVTLLIIAAVIYDIRSQKKGS